MKLEWLIGMECGLYRVPGSLHPATLCSAVGIVS